MEELAKLLGTTKERLKNLGEEMGEFAGKKDVPQKLAEELTEERNESLAQLGLSSVSEKASLSEARTVPSESSDREDVLTALRGRVEKTESGLIKLLKEPDCRTQTGCALPVQTALELANPPEGFFLKKAKAQELLLTNPPQNVLDTLGYETVEKMLAEEDLFEVFSSLRFLEERKWLNEIFFAPYNSLTPDDFEKREIVVRFLEPQKWGPEAAAFVRKKFHNTTHLKELGVLVVIPVGYEMGVLTRLFSMMLHYLSEIPFYARYFELIAKEPKTFAKKLTAALRGDVRETIPPVENLFVWLILQRYLAKEDPRDPRLALPHISPEAMHWRKATDNLGRLGEKDPELGLSFWAGKAHVAGIFEGKITSFNFEDNVFSTVREREAEQYTYHMHEALWNRLFTAYFDKETLETLMVEDFAQGFVGFRIRSTEK